MTIGTALGSYTLDEEILPYSKTVSHIAMYTKNGKEINFKNCRLFSPLKIDDREIFPENFDAVNLYPVPGSDCEKYQEVNIPVQNGSRIKGRFRNTEGATALIIVLQLEKV